MINLPGNKGILEELFLDKPRKQTREEMVNNFFDSCRRIGGSGEKWSEEVATCRIDDKTVSLLLPKGELYGSFKIEDESGNPVSYTHLTLPTICSV